MIELGRHDLALCVRSLKLSDGPAAAADAGAVAIVVAVFVVWSYLAKRDLTRSLGSSLEKFLSVCQYKPRVYSCENDPCRFSSTFV